jgi:hypothetical protein
MISVGVETTSYLYAKWVNLIRLQYSDFAEQEKKHTQFDDVRMAEGAHVLEFALDPCFGLFSLYNGF